MGFRCSVHCAQLARGRWFQYQLPSVTGGSEIGQWRPTPPALGPMSAQGLAFTNMFVLNSNTQFSLDHPGAGGPRYTDDFNAVKALGRRTGSTRTDDQTALAAVLGRERQRPLNQAAKSGECQPICPFLTPTGFSRY